MYKELLTQTVQNAFLWYKKLSIINIWYCWIIIGPIRSNIPATSFYVWQSWQYIFLESRDVSYAFFVLCLWQIVLFLLLPSINHYPCDQLWDCADVLGQQTCPRHPMLFSHCIYFHCASGNIPNTSFYWLVVYS